MEHSTNRFGIVPLSVGSDACLSDGAVRTYWVLSMHCNHAKECFPKQELIARFIGRSRKRIPSFIAELRRRGHVHTRRTPRGLLYILPGLPDRRRGVPDMDPGDSDRGESHTPSTVHQADRDAPRTGHQDERDAANAGHQDQGDVPVVGHHPAADASEPGQHTDTDVPQTGHHDVGDVPAVEHHDGGDTPQAGHHADGDVPEPGPVMSQDRDMHRTRPTNRPTADTHVCPPQPPQPQDTPTEAISDDGGTARSQTGGQAAPFTPDPGFRANDYLRLWLDLGLPLSRSVAPYQAELEIDRLHRQDHVPTADIEAAMRKLAAAKQRNYRKLKWAWQRGPQALRARTKSGDLRLDAVLAWEDFDAADAAGPSSAPGSASGSAPGSNGRLQRGQEPMTGREHLMRQYETTRLRRPDDHGQPQA